MKKIISIGLLTIAIMIGLSIQTSASTELSPKKVQKLDQKMTKKKARLKRFKTQKEYQRLKQRGSVANKRQHSHRSMDDMFGSHTQKRVRKRYIEDDWNDGYSYPRGPRAKGYRYFKRGWYLAYRYDRAGFYDRYGYHYGYFNSYGFYFDGIFYGYDRYYRYQDRLRGRGLFDNRYYMPEDASRYGFCPPRPARTYPHPFRR